VLPALTQKAGRRRLYCLSLFRHFVPAECLIFIAFLASLLYDKLVGGITCVTGISMRMPH
jgi:hypothetical protein